MEPLISVGIWLPLVIRWVAGFPTKLGTNGRQLVWKCHNNDGSTEIGACPFAVAVPLLGCLDGVISILLFGILLLDLAVANSES